MSILVVLVVVGLSWAMVPGMRSDRSAEDDACSVTEAEPITWSSSSHDTTLLAATPGSARRVMVRYTAADDKLQEMAVLYGADAGASKIALTKRNTVAGTASIQYPQGPGLRVTRGWSFITWRWPLIWTESIDAGSIGTTAIVNVSENEVDLYLVLNRLDATGSEPVRPADCTDPNARLYVRIAGQSGSVSVAVPSGFQAVRRTYETQRDEHGRVVKTTLKSQTPLKIGKSDQGRIQVQDDAFLQKVLDCAARQSLFEIP